jgi:hypothetical protein
MPRKANHEKARTELARLAPDVLQAITARLPAGQLRKVHQWAEQKSLDLTSAIRELIAIGMEAEAHPDEPLAAAVRKAAAKWKKPVERALLAGRSPIQPFLAKKTSDQELEALPAILSGLDYQNIFKAIKEKADARGTYIDRVWGELKAGASEPIRELMSGLDNLEQLFLARKKVRSVEWPDGQEPRIYWILSDEVMAWLKEPAPKDADVEKVRKLISARYLFAEDPSQPWRLVWDE